MLRNPDLRPGGWIGVELRHFLALDAVASEGSFNRAAQRLGYTQSAVSQQIAALERVVGEQLVDRGSHPVRLTRAGEIVIEHARAIGARMASAQADLQSLAAGGLNPLQVGFPGHGLGALMPAVLRELDEVYPDLIVRVVPTTHEEELLEMLRTGEVDVGFVYLHLPLPAEDAEHVLLFEDDYVLVVGPDWAETKPSKQLTVDDLAELPLIGLKRPRTCEITDFFHSHHLHPTWVVASNDIETIYASVTADVGIAILPRLATLSMGTGARVLELDCGLPPRRMGIAWSKARQASETVGTFVRAAKAEAARLTRATQLKVAS